MKSVLVTGAGGFLGYAVTRRFRKAAWNVIGVGSRVDSPNGCDEMYQLVLPDPALEHMLRDHRPNVIVHCAGRASVPGSFTAPGRDFRAGPLVLFDLLDQVRIASPSSRVIFLSSAAVYGIPRCMPIDESHPLSPISPYGFHKRVCEEVCREYAQVFGIASTVVRIFSAYGPGLRRQVVWDVCEKVSRDVEVSLQGTGRESRDFIHVDDVADALYLIATRASCAGETYNLASGVETSIKELAAAVVARLAPGKKVKFDGVVPPGTPHRWQADISKMKAIGFHPRHDFASGLEATLAHYCMESNATCLRKSA